jgi:NADH:ubiquinone oxidoreductase subunit 2 (subunit N)
MMYMRESRKEVPVTRVPIALRVALAACMIATVYLGIFPSVVLQYTQDSAERFVPKTLPEAPSPALVSTIPGKQ